MRRGRRTGAPSRPPGRPAVFSGLTVAAAMAALVFMPQRFLYSMAVAGASAAIFSSVIAILVVPSLLALLGTRIDALSIRRGPAVSDESDGWYRLARGVMRRPVRVAVCSAAVMLAAATPLLWTTLTGPSAEAVPPGPLLRRLQVPRRALPAQRNRGGDGHGRRQGSATATGRVPAADRSARRGGGRVAVRPRPGKGVAYTNFALDGPALSGELAGRGQRDPRPAARPEPRQVLVSGNTAGSST